MSKNSTCKDAIAAFEAKSGKKASEEEHVSLICMLPPIAKMDNALNSLVKCQKLSMSTNQIDKIISLSALTNLRILSLGRNNIKRIEKLDDVAGTLEELWISYNLLEKLDGLSACKKLRVLYMSNNKLANFAELNKLKDNPALVDLMLLGNPMYATLPDEAKRREEVIKNCPPVANNETFKLDGILVTPLERGSALGLPPA